MDPVEPSLWNGGEGVVQEHLKYFQAVWRLNRKKKWEKKKDTMWYEVGYLASIYVVELKYHHKEYVCIIAKVAREFLLEIRF